MRQGGTKDEDFAVWREDRNIPLGEYRGSSIIERYLDPADPNLPDFATDSKANADIAQKIEAAIRQNAGLIAEQILARGESGSEGSEDDAAEG